MRHLPVLLGLGALITWLSAQSHAEQTVVANGQTIQTVFAQPISAFQTTVVQPLFIPAYSYVYNEQGGLSSLEKPYTQQEKIIVTIDEDDDDWPTAQTGDANEYSKPSEAKANDHDEAVETRALRVLERNCASCHTGKSAKAGMKIFTDNRALNGNANRWLIWDKVESGQMPPKYKLPQNDAVTLREWARTQ